MLKRTVFLIAATVLSAGGLTVAAQGGPPAPSAGEKKVCRTSDTPGSRLGKGRTCKTAAEWAELDRETKATVEHIQASRNWRMCPDPKVPNC